MSESTARTAYAVWNSARQRGYRHHEPSPPITRYELTYEYTDNAGSTFAVITMDPKHC
jgi:hypothetical protein